ncbi:protein phosphatase [Hydrogenivirga caldilitoris]|uniref:Protein phosphatase n=1 Tax=Hydrogenivirga caldilitoris TaxID=246264 RepID=A0A497XPX0_9AQUI|nr:PP2C family serine/threonine-protein phosphatase [Hydrogenivirga caldilitoris]RLJ70948.1 protein phosphatase [Hydrogenivirga caldilitoris]
MRLEVSYLTNRGRVRSKNEDALLIDQEVICGLSLDKPVLKTFHVERQVSLAVADGMGGLPCGEEASRLTLEYLRGFHVSDREELLILLKKAKRHLDSYVEVHGRCRGMGTAVAGIFIESSKAVVFNVGDCRVYRKREQLQRLTRDHTEAYELYEGGIIGEEEIRNHPYRNILTSAITGGYFEEFEVFVHEVDVNPGDLFLICSDGLWGELHEGDMSLCTGMSTFEGSVCLFEKAYRGGSDNISFILAKVL